jgi:hypothetical protein
MFVLICKKYIAKFEILIFELVYLQDVVMSNLIK